jgi:hypothetical protein
MPYRDIQSVPEAPIASKKVHRGKRNALPKLPQIDEIVNNYLDKLFAPLKDRGSSDWRRRGG